MEKKYALVREFIYGWDWSEFSDNNGLIPLIYNTIADARASLDVYIRDVNEPYENDMAIAEVKFNLINK